MSTPMSITILRQRGRTCSGCHAPISVGVMVKAADESVRAHLVFCRRCSARIGVVSAAIGKTNKQSRKRSGG